MQVVYADQGITISDKSLFIKAHRLSLPGNRVL